MITLYDARICNECNSPEVHEMSAGDEGWSICSDCHAVEGGDKEGYVDNNGTVYTLHEADVLINENKATIYVPKKRLVL